MGWSSAHLPIGGAVIDKAGTIGGPAPRVRPSLPLEPSILYSEKLFHNKPFAWGTFAIRYNMPHPRGQHQQA
ncbi:hypothetical protein CBM2626_A210047 [Cupriavidus taiwanensis]|nr:hypothetical protein CBM2626_A210047 [Cupriavidus taiwanensis]